MDGTCVHDVDAVMTVHGGICILTLNIFTKKLGLVSINHNPLNPEVSHYQGTLWDFHKVVTTLPEE